ncbi:MAG: DUF899 domain-containing protein [Stenotrophobium sp.]
MPQPTVVSRDEFLAACEKFLVKEKKFTRQREQLAAERRKLPWLRVERDYVFDGPDGKESLSDLFEGRSQLIVYHFMFGPGWEAGCPGCSRWADSFDGTIAHLNQRDVTLIAASRAPYKKLAAYQKRMGWRFKWVSSGGSDFNFDFQASFTPEELKNQRAYFNFTWQDPHASEREGASVFCKDQEGRIYLTYSTHARGIDAMCVDYQYLDLTPKGRDEAGQKPHPQAWVRRHDEYGTA